MTIVEFLEARLNEDEADATEADATEADGDRLLAWSMHDHMVIVDSGFMQTFTPSRVLREIAAKRVILEIHHTSDSEVTYPKWDSEARIIGLTNPCVGCGTGICDYWIQDINDCPELQALASIYSSHPDYQQEWAQ
ncbi:DUF6221 family protein [Rhodococcus qingshengii]|uniref:DUF6221 family protein n=1 Tax=Rhodococcus qingshengii TaxID=334542 RepID=UPI0024BA5B19|nr:DUF6221 family protein [Rhodococcus qingshengii]MDJ0489134.1 DUF6221 family protein [Rhodococcus qingshengii]